jgi:hypothetical protein
MSSLTILSFIRLFGLTPDSLKNRSIRYELNISDLRASIENGMLFSFIIILAALMAVNDALKAKFNLLMSLA